MRITIDERGAEHVALSFLFLATVVLHPVRSLALFLFPALHSHLILTNDDRRQQRIRTRSRGSFPGLYSKPKQPFPDAFLSSTNEPNRSISFVFHFLTTTGTAWTHTEPAVRRVGSHPPAQLAGPLPVSRPSRKALRALCPSYILHAVVPFHNKHISTHT